VHQYFSYQEQKYLYSLSPEKQAEAFFTLWTCKEAYWKATGIGLSGLYADETGLAGEQTITIKQLLLDEEYRGAVAMCGESTVVRCFRLLLAL
jgi:4'-phosphopantetheinyl transferase